MNNRTRIRHLRTACDFEKAAEFDALCGKTRAQTSAYLRGEVWPPETVLTAIRDHLDRIGAAYDLEWLIPSSTDASASPAIKEGARA